MFNLIYFMLLFIVINLNYYLCIILKNKLFMKKNYSWKIIKNYVKFIVKKILYFYKNLIKIILKII